MTADNTSQAFKHIFMSPSSVDQEPKATQSGNARIHGMHTVMKVLIACVATQVSALAKYKGRLALLTKQYPGMLCLDIGTGFFNAGIGSVYW